MAFNVVTYNEKNHCFYVLGTRLPRECDDIIANVSGIYEIYPDGTSKSVFINVL